LLWLLISNTASAQDIISISGTVTTITREQIAASGYAETAQVIQSLTPSVNFPRPTITDGTDTVRPATLRGLGLIRC
jgi:iron complex outermembrane receptor protein